MFFQLIFLLLSVCYMAKSQSIIEAPMSEVNENLTLECHRRVYNFKVSQVDQNGKGCWDILSVHACWGRCDTSEIADFRFPFKRTNHHVCLHYGRNKAFVILRNCAEGASASAARYEYYEAADCKCQQCITADTSCEGLRFRRDGSPPDDGEFKKIIRERDDYYY